MQQGQIKLLAGVVCEAGNRERPCTAVSTVRNLPHRIHVHGLSAALRVGNAHEVMLYPVKQNLQHRDVVW
jgi:hypothetical protein